MAHTYEPPPPPPPKFAVPATPLYVPESSPLPPPPVPPDAPFPVLYGDPPPPPDLARKQLKDINRVVYGNKQNDNSPKMTIRELNPEEN